MTNDNGMCFWERVCISAGFKLIHDGRNSPGELQQKLGVTETNLYTKKYRWYVDGKPVNTWVTFIYDERELFDIRVTYKDRQEKGEMALERRSNVKSRQSTGNGNKGSQQDARREGSQVAAGEAGEVHPLLDVCPADGDAGNAR